jgi:hypothetical protein
LLFSHKRLKTGSNRGHVFFGELAMSANKNKTQKKQQQQQQQKHVFMHGK